MVFYVPPHRAVENLQDMSVVLGGKRRCCAARELTKVFETFERGTLESVLATFISAEPRGELTLVVGGSTEAELNTPAHIEVRYQCDLKYYASLSSSLKF
jgi:16S rRNA (cytidine1402-2'-O)-methyltransferase